MKSQSLLVLSLLMLLGLFSCRPKAVYQVKTSLADSTQSAKPLTLQFKEGNETTLLLSGSTKIEDSIRVRFIKTLFDSRCPVDVNCVWEGQVKVQMYFISSKGEKVTKELVLGAAEDASFEFENYKWTLKEVLPHPTSQMGFENYKGNYQVKMEFLPLSEEKEASTKK